MRAPGHIGIVLLGLIFGAAALAVAPPKPALPEPLKLNPVGVAVLPGSEPLKWLDDWDAAQRMAARDNRSLLVYFHSPVCGWCQRMNEEILTAVDVRKRMSEFILLKVNILEDEKTPARFRVRATPTLVFLSPEGRESMRIDGFTEMPGLIEVLDQILANRLQSQDDKTRTLIQQLNERKLSEQGWADLVIAMAESRHREEIHQAIVSAAPQPRQAMVRLLDHPLLAVRLGALEVLEELAGEDFGYNPWLEGTLDNRDNLEKWIAWANSTNSTSTNQPALFRVLTPDETSKYLVDLISDDLDRSSRARRMLEKGRGSSLEGIDGYLAAHPDLPAGSRNKLRELRYMLLLPSAHGIDPANLAHRLVFGNLDVRMKALRDTAAAGPRALPVIQEFLSEREALLRETAVDALVTAGGRRAVGILDRHLKKETDANVTYEALRQLGNLPSKKALDILVLYLSHANEDLVIVALESIGKLRSSTVSDQISKCLGDPRWRVRVSALKAAEDLNLKTLGARVAAMLDDRDDFVRSAAVDALARLGAKEAVPKLQTLFAKDDNLKGPIINAFYAADLPIPEPLIQSLAGASPSVLLSLLDHVRAGEAKEGPLLNSLATHKDADVSCAALRLIAERAAEYTPFQKTLAGQIQSGEPRRMLAIFDSLAMDFKQLARYNPAVRKVELSAAAATLKPPAPASGTNAVDDIFNAFESKAAAPPAAAPTGQTKGGAVDDIFGAFEGKAGPAENYVQTLLRVGNETLKKSGGEELKSAAARMLIGLGDPAGIPRMLHEWPGLSVEQRSALARNVNRIRNQDGLPLIKKLLTDPDSQVRETTCDTLLEDGADESCLQLVLTELQGGGARLGCPEAFPGIQSLISRPNMRTVVNRSCLDWLAKPSSEELRTLALILLGSAWSSGNESAVVPFLESKIPWQRRAAFFALGKNQKETFLKVASRAAADESEFVREVVPHVFMAEDVRGSWMQYFDDQKQHEEYDRSYSSRRGDGNLDAEALKALRLLATDRSDRVRFQALFCLITQSQPVDLTDVAAMLEKMPQDSELLSQFSEHVVNHYATLGKDFAIVMPYLNFRRRGDDERTQQLREYFGLTEDGETALPDSPAGQMRQPVVASYVTPPAAAARPVRPENFQIVFFSKPGCKDCEAVAKKLAQLKETFPELAVREYDINKTASVLLNEALSTKFDVPASIRLVAPSVFSGDGYLIKDDITLARLGQMLMRAGTVPLASWLTVPKENLAAAHLGIVERYQSTSASLIIFAGLLDGINPCAFATIIFLLSYLQVTRKSSREIMQIGVAYVCGVFIAYFLIGMGMARVAAMVSRLRWAGALLTYVMAGFAVVIAALSVRDGVLSMRAQLSEMTLQLPEILKTWIHRIIRHGVRQAHFVLVAFFMGVAISFLELACTGQVYLPTITYMIQQGEARATLDLLTYNLAFILPLVIVFIMSYCGLRSETLLKLLKRRAAWIKFGTALLFLLLAAFLVFGSQIAQP